MTIIHLLVSFKKSYWGLIFIICSIVFPFIFLKDMYPFHRFGMFAEPIQHTSQYEKFYVFYKKNSDSSFLELRPQDIPLNANAYKMQLRKHHYQQKHSIFIDEFDKIIRKKINLNYTEQIQWKWYHVFENKNIENELDSICVFSN